MNFRKMTVMLSLVTTAMLLSACDRSETTYMVGTLERDRVELKVESNEPIVAIRVKDGQEVSAGDIVLEQDAAEIQGLAKQGFCRVLVARR